MFGFKKRFTSLLIRHQITAAEQLERLSKGPFDKILRVASVYMSSFTMHFIYCHVIIYLDTTQNLVALAA